MPKSIDSFGIFDNLPLSLSFLDLENLQIVLFVYNHFL